MPNGNESDTEAKEEKGKAETFGLLSVVTFAVTYPFKATAISQEFASCKA